jgi:multiple sugar transport system permease protein
MDVNIRSRGCRAKSLLCAALAGFAVAAQAAEPVTVRVFQLPRAQAATPEEVALHRIHERFLERHPEIRLESATSLRIEGDVMDAAPLMAIAGGTSPDVLYVNFRQSDTYIQRGFLAPLDEFIGEIPDDELAEIIPPTVAPVARRPGPDGVTRTWMMPYQTLAIVMMYRRDLFAAAGLDPDRPPRDWEELRETARRLANPSKGIYALGFATGSQAAYSMFTFLCSAGARVVEQQADGSWRAAFDSEAAVDAFAFVDALQRERVARDGREGPIVYRGADINARWEIGQIGILFGYLGSGRFTGINPQLIGVAPVPRGPNGLSSAEVNARMYGIFAGQRDPRVRRAAWAYIRFLCGREARRIFTETMVEQGAWRMISPSWLREFGFAHLARLAPAGLEEAFQTALANGTPEPYGRNCQYVYTYLTRPLDRITHADLGGLDEKARRARIRDELRAAARETNEKMLGVLPPDVRRSRDRTAWSAALFVAVAFVALYRFVFRSIRAGRAPSGRAGVTHRDRAAFWPVAPALFLILMWQYYPLIRGSAMAFQDFSVMGDSAWVGIRNFADVIYDARFWQALGNSFYFCALWLALGFFPPLMLAVLLQEIPRGKILFRLLFYLPAVVSGVVILFMWRGLFDPSPDGLLNRVLAAVNVPAQTWLQDPKLAMLCVVFPLAWAHLGPGSIIYLAALKGIPDELYEAADLDGASFVDKVRYVVVPYLRPLLVINAVGAVIFGFKSVDAVLAMTGGGPNLATHVAGYEIWQRSFLFLEFGQGTAMAWILGVLLLAFTAYQLKILNKVEFRTVNR